MGEELLGKVNAVRRRAQSIGWSLASVRALTLVLAVWWMVASADLLVRWQDEGLRWLASAAAYSAVAVGAWQAWRATRWTRTLSLVAVAQRIEERFPRLAGKLACACDLAQLPLDPTRFGSVELRRATIDSASRLVAGVDLGESLDPRPARRALAYLLLPIAAWLALGAWDVAQTRSAALRLTAPWLDRPWPRVNRLEWSVLPTRVVAGREVALEIRDVNERELSGVELWYRYEDEVDERMERAPMRPRESTFVFRFDSLQRDVWVRAVGGDDDTLPWSRIRVEQPPRLTSLEVLVRPPGYTGASAQRAGQPLRGLVGSQIEIRGVTASRLRAARVLRVVDDAPVAVGEILGDATRFQFLADRDAGWVVEQPGEFALELEDEFGLRGEVQRWNLIVANDEPPSVAWRLPEPDAAATPQGQVQVKATVSDDWGVRRAALKYRVAMRRTVTEERASDARSGSLTDAARGVDRSPDEVPPPGVSSSQEWLLWQAAAPPQENSGRGGEGTGHTLELERAWDWATLPTPLIAGDSLELWIVAEDFCGQITESPPRRMTVVSIAELDERIGQRDSRLLSVLSEALQAEREVARQVGAVELLFREAARVDTRQADQLQAADVRHRQVARLLGDSPEGALGIIAATLDEVAANRLERSGLVQRLLATRKQIEKLQADALPGISPELTAIRKEIAAVRAESQLDSEAVESLQKRLGEAEEKAITISRRLEQLLESLAPWDEARRAIREFSKVAREQDDIRRRTAEWLRATGMPRGGDSNPQGDGERLRLAERQFELERRFSKNVARLEQLQRTWAQGADDDSRRALDEAIGSARQSLVETRMRDAGEQLTQQRPGRALQAQAEALDELRELMRRLGVTSTADDTPPALPRVEQLAGTLLERQRAIREPLVELQAQVEGRRSELSEFERRRLRELTAEERELSRLASDAADQASDTAPGIALALRGAAMLNRRLIEQLASPRPFPEAVRTIDSLIARLDMVAHALRGEPATNQDERPEMRSIPAAEGRPPAPRVRSMAELKMLQTLQSELAERTAQVDRARREAGQMTDALERELREIRREQGELIDLIERMLTSDMATQEPER